MKSNAPLWIVSLGQGPGGGGSVGAAVVSGSSGATQTNETWGETTYTVYTFTDPVTPASVALTDEAKQRIEDEDVLRAVAQATDPDGLIAEYGDVLKDALITTPMSDPGHSISISEAGLVTVLLVAGGGGAGNDAPGGGGGVTPITMMLDAGEHSIGVGSGGLHGNRINSGADGTNGMPSWIGRVAAAGGGAGSGAGNGAANGGKDGATGGGGGRYRPGGAAISGEQGYSSNMISGDRAAGGAGGLPTGSGQTDSGPGYTWIDGNTYGAGGLDGATVELEQVIPNSGNGGHAYNGEGSSGIVIVAVEA